VTYERYRFLDANGPVPVLLCPDACAAGGIDVLWTNLSPQSCPAWVLKRTGVTDLHLPRGEVAIIYGDTIPALRAAPRTFRADGYEPVVVSTALRSLADWPAHTEVRVNRADDGRILYRVAPPDVGTSDVGMFAPKPVGVYLSSESWAVARCVTPQSTLSAFFDMPTVTIGVHLEDRAGQAELLNYDTEVGDDGAVLIRPRYPEWAFIRLTYDLVDREVFDSVICITRAGGVHTSTALYPGTVCFGPVPVDRYEFRMLRPVRGVPRVLKTWGPLDVHKGINALQWPN
jgi:hypothetical protein